MPKRSVKLNVMVSICAVFDCSCCSGVCPGKHCVLEQVKGGCRCYVRWQRIPKNDGAWKEALFESICVGMACSKVCVNVWGSCPGAKVCMCRDCYNIVRYLVEHG